MLATASYPTSVLQPSTEDSSQYRPVKDIDSFKALLPQPVEFAESSSTGGLSIPEHKFQPLNDPTSPNTPHKTEKPIPSSSSSKSSDTKPAHASPSSPTRSLYTSPLIMSWPETITSSGSGLFNIGNTCFLNSTLQCLLHTPPLLRILISHRESQCTTRSFCMSCEMRKIVVQTYHKNAAFCPSIANKLHVIAKHMKKGRQEDSHEFLRYAIDALQKSCLAGLPPKIDPKIAETTWVHKLFGGRLRSRVTCGQCGFNSDTMDSILDISLDISNIANLKEAFQKFVGIDHLKGGNKYKCEKCKKLVPAEKQFTIHDAPRVLTVHLKRFSPIGRKIGHFVKYDQTLKLQPYMSEGQHGPTYSLFGVVCHAGGGPHSGHYIAHVKDRNGHWWEMNDELVSKSNPLDLKSAYMLFYIQNQLGASDSPSTPVRINGTMKKRKAPDDEETSPSSPTNGHPAPFIGPVLPPSQATPHKRSKSEPRSDPQANTLKRKIEATAKHKGSLVDESYGSDEEGGSLTAPKSEPASPDDQPLKTPQKLTSQANSSSVAPSSTEAIPPSSFYSTSSKSSDQNNSNPGKGLGLLSSAMRDRHGRPNNLNPYTRLRDPSNLFGKKKRHRPGPRGL